MKKIYLLFFALAVMISARLQAQVSGYSFAESTEAYTAVTGTNITATGDDGSQNNLPIGFTFKFGGFDYTTFSANTNGWIRLGADMPTTGTWDNTNFGAGVTTHRPLIAAFWDDNHRNNGSISYSLTGSAPNQVLTIGWDNVNIGGGGSTSASNLASFKMRIYETTNAIEFVYGPTMAAAGSLSASVGLNDNTSFLSVTPGATATTSASTANNSISSTANLAGKKYTFTAPVVSSELMDYVNLQFPGTANIVGGTNVTVYAQGWEPGITEAPGAGAGVQAWIGYSSTNSNPNTWINWVPAVFNVQVGNNDEFMADIGASLAPGTYYYASRWRLGTGAYSYGGFNAGGGDGFWDGTNDVSGVLTITVPPPPANDVCSGAIVIPGAGPFPFITGATGNGSATDTNDPVPTCQSNAHKGIWYTFTPAVSGAYTISSCQTAAPLSNITDNVLSIYTSAGGCAGPFTSIGCDDDGCTTLNLQGVLTNISLTGGTTYYILVYGYDTNTGNVQLNISAPVACTAPASVAVNSTTSTGTNVTWTGTGSYILEYGLTGFTPGTGATAGTGGTIINPAVSPQAIGGLTASTGYQVYVRQDCTGAGNGYSANSPVVAFTTLGTPPPCTTNSAPANGATNVPSPGGATLIEWNAQPAATSYNVYFGTVNPPVTNLGNTTATSVTITGLDYNTTYYWYIAPVNAGSPATGCSSTTWSFTTAGPPPPPANDEPCAAQTIGLTPLAGTTVSSTQNLPPLTCSGSTSADANDVWYQFTATSNGDAVIVLDNTGAADLVLQAFSGTCTALTSIACVDDYFTDETLPLTGLVAGQTYWVRVYGYDGEQGIFEISVTGAALPVAIEYFRGTRQNGKNVLDWKVSCFNSPSVTLSLERSEDGRNYKAISTTTESADRCLQPFNYRDMNPSGGINYYRLKSTDVDGKITYSNVVALLNKEKGFEIVSLAPNPVQDETTLIVTSAEKTIIEIAVTDLNGKQISKQRLSLISGNNLLPLNFRNVAAGTYQVTGLTADGQMRSLRFVKQ